MGGWCCEMAAFGTVKSSNSYDNHKLGLLVVGD